MRKKKASEIFGPVDPGLTVVDRGWRGKKKAKTIAEIAVPSPGPYKPQPITEEEWEKSEGVICPMCGEKTLQLFHYGYVGNRKACKKCIDRRINLINNRRNILGSRNRRR